MVPFLARFRNRKSVVSWESKEIFELTRLWPSEPDVASVPGYSDLRLLLLAERSLSSVIQCFSSAFRPF